MSDRLGVPFTPRTRVLFGPGTITELGAVATGLGAHRALLVTDPGLVAAGHAGRAARLLIAAGVEVLVYDQVRENPTATDVERCRAALGAFDAQVLVGIGGGSSIDVAKGCNFLRAGGGTMADYRGTHTARGTLLPLIAIPTTAGTGTEVQSFALIGTDDTHQKMACGDPQAAPAVAILDPELTVSQPRHVTAHAGLDAIGHAVETAVTAPRNAVSTLFSTAAFTLANTHLPRVLEQPDDLAARGAMLQAASFAGVAIEHSMLGAAHAMANPLTAQFGVVHGQAVGTVLPHVVRFNAELDTTGVLYAQLAHNAGLCTAPFPPAAAVETLAARLADLLEACGLPPHLGALGVTEDAVPALAQQAAEQWTGRFNPRPVGEPEFARLFRAALEG